LIKANGHRATFEVGTFTKRQKLQLILIRTKLNVFCPAHVFWSASSRCGDENAQRDDQQGSSSPGSVCTRFSYASGTAGSGSQLRQSVGALVPGGCVSWRDIRARSRRRPTEPAHPSSVELTALIFDTKSAILRYWQAGDPHAGDEKGGKKPIPGGFGDAFLSSLLMIIVSELGDKTFFIAAVRE